MREGAEVPSAVTRDLTMKMYTLDSVFTFGRYSGQTLREVLAIEPDYLDWCLRNLGHFCMSDETVQAIKQILPSFSLSPQAETCRSENLWAWERDRYEKEPAIEEIGDVSSVHDGLDMPG